MLTTLLLTVLTAAQPAVPKDPPAKLELFAKEEWYKKQEAMEQRFDGTIQKAKRTKAGGRFNPYQLVRVGYVNQIVERKVGDKIVKDIVAVPYHYVVDIYVAGKNDILDAYVNKQVRIFGKAAMLEDQKTYEIWPGRLEVIEEKKGEAK